MTAAILIAGLVVALSVAFVMRRPEWRLAALLFGMLSIPGNVDNLMPQMRLDPHLIADATAPVFSIVDLFLLWGLILTVREQRLRGRSLLESRILLAAVVFAVVAALVSAVNVVQGADPAAAARGAITLGRIPVILAIAIGLRDVIGDGWRLAVGCLLGLVAVIGNGLYTSTVTDAARFSAATFGRNGLAVILVVGALVATGLAFETWRRSSGPHARLLGTGSFGLAMVGLFAAIATGTRISLLVLVPVAIGTLVINRSWTFRTALPGCVLVIAATVVVAGAAAIGTPEGQRALSVITDPGGTVDIITDPEGEPFYSPARTRSTWWRQALEMLRSDPITGIGAYEWNNRRYDVDPEAPPVVADPHNTYVQMATEYGVPVVIMYVVGIGALAVAVAITGWRPSSPTSRSWTATTLMSAGFMIPLTEFTNSHLFNVRIGAVAWILIGAALTLSLLPTVLDTPRPRTRSASNP